MASHFRISTAVAGNVPVIRLIRPEAPFDPDRLADQVLRWIEDGDTLPGDDPVPGQARLGLQGW